MKRILEDPSIKKIGQNIKYDFMIFKKYGINIEPIEDTMLLSYTLDAGNNRHNMDTLSEIHTWVIKQFRIKKLLVLVPMLDVNLKDATKYAAEDADITLRLYNICKDRLDSEKTQ